MKTTKFLLPTLIAAAAMTATAYAELTTVATMSDLVSAGDLGTGVALSTDYTAESNVYTFGGEGAILNIENSSILDYINGGSGYLTIAAWINPEATSGVQSIFGYGAPSDGFKMTTNGSALAFTTKGVADKDTLGTITAGEWNLVALTINLSGEYGSKYLIGESDYWTRTLGAWNTPSEANQTFAIGSGNSESNRELFTGSIANLTVTYSESAATNAEVVALLGDAPVIQINTDGKLVWAGTADSNTWNITATNWLDGEAAAAFTSDADVAFTDTATNKTVALESGVTVTAGDVLVGGSGYVFSTSSGTATLAGKTLTVSKGASLTVGSTKNNTVNLEFENIVLSGKISYNNGDDTWSSLDLAGGELHIYDGANPGTNLTINSVTVSQDSTITAEWDKSLNIGALSGSANLSMTGGSSGNLTVNITNLDSYSGTITTNNGSWGLTLNLGAEGKTTTSSANVNVNSGTLNIAGTTTLGTLDLGGTTVSATGNATVGTLMFGRGSGANTTTISGNLTVTGNVTQTSTGQTDNEVLALAENASLTIDGTLGTTVANANDRSQVSYVLNIGNGASLSANTIAQANDLDVTLGTNATMSAEALTLNAVWDAKTHTFTGASSDTSVISAKGISLTNANSNLSVSTAKVLVGANGISGSGSMTLTDAVLGVQDAATSWSSSVAMTLGGATTTDAGYGKSISLDGVLSGSGSLIKTGEGMLTLSSANTYSGGTTISAGTLVVGIDGALGDGAVEISGGQLSISEGVSISNSLKVVLTSVGHGDLTTGYEVGSGKATILGSGEVSAGTSLEVSVEAELLTAIWTMGITKQYQIFESSSLLDGELNVSYTSAAEGSADLWSSFYAAGGFCELDQGSGVLTIGIPEPSAFGLLAGVGALALVVSRRKRRK